MKVFWEAEAQNGFVLNAREYEGEIVMHGPTPHRNLAMDMIMELYMYLYRKPSPNLNTGRDIVTDNYFSSHHLAVAAP